MVPRAAPPQRVADLAVQWAAHTIVEEDTQKALALAITAMQPDDLLLVTGSLYLVGDAKRLLPDLLVPTTTAALTQVNG
jgi:folylpolyglutamate synthase/dihydropteroate synthase